MRFTVKFINGFWVVFDTVRFENHSTAPLRRLADERVANLNGAA